MADISIWKKRFTARQFYEDEIPSKDQIDFICDPLNYVPYQVCEGQKTPDIFWILIGPDKKEFKIWLVNNFFYSIEEKDIKSYFVALIDAPYVLLCLNLEKRLRKTKKLLPTNKETAIRNVGVATGVIISQAISIGLDVGQFGCVQNDINIIKELRKQIKVNFKEEWNFLNSNDSID